MRAYLAKYPEGEYSEIARDRLAEIAPPEPEPVDNTQAKADEQRLLANPIARLLAERALGKAGYDTGGIDGRITAQTRRAIAAFQEANGLPVTGYVGQRTALQLLNNQ